MTLLLDTHTVLWWLAGEPLGAQATARIADPSVLVAVSAASVWEAGIKAVLGKLDVPEPLIHAVQRGGFEPLPISLDHADHAARLPPHHRDSFDRMLVAQAQLEGLTLVTRDPAFDPYDVPVLRC